MKSSKERRKERRYIVIGIDVAVDGRDCQVIDISRSGVRVVRPKDLFATAVPTTLQFRVGDLACPLIYNVVGTLVRQTALEIVYRYEAPCQQWEGLLKSLDTFETTRLQRLRL